MSATVEFSTERIVITYRSVDPTDVDEAVSDLHELRQIVAALKAWEDVLTVWLNDAIGRNAIDVDGIGRVEVKRGTDRKEWDSRALVRAVLDSRRSPDLGTGETDPTDDGRAEVSGEALTCSPDLSRVLDVWNLGAPRVTALRERGIDPDEFCASNPGRLRVVIT